MSARSALTPAAVDELLDASFFELAEKTIKGLAMDAVQEAGSGHPGMPMGTALMAVELWTRFMVHDPSEPRWPDRDRFVLSAGHGSMLLYSLLHLSGYDLPIEELRAFRQWGSKTPGHPEYGHTAGVEVTTGPLGTGFATGVGMALAERILAARYNRGGHDIVDHFTYGIVSDGDLQEGVSAEAASFAGHQGLGKLIYLYDDNKIQIDGSTDLTFTEDVKHRFEAYGWQVIAVDGHRRAAVADALVQARADLSRPTLIACRTTIGHGSPNLAGSEKTHGAPLGAAEIEATKQAMDWPRDPFHVPEAVRAGFARVAGLRRAQREAWAEKWAAYEAAHPALARELSALQAGELPEGTFDALPTFEAGTSIATRKAGAKVIAALSKAHPTLVGGSADLTGSNGVAMPDAGVQQSDSPGGRFIHFGVREHGMGAICNGLALHGGLRAFDATFLVFSDFMRGAVRLSALMGLPVVHVFSHDSFYLGEDGPTHQPIEHTMALRTIPNLYVTRPADANETAAAWKLALERKDGPTAILVTRQDLPVMAEAARDISCGAYVLRDPEGEGALDGILIATGSEVPLALAAAEALAARGRRVRVVSMPCWEAFEAQTQSYRDEVLPPGVTRRVSVEAGITLGWQKWAGVQVGVDHFGASAPAEVLAEQFGFTTERVVEAFESV